MTQQRRTQTIDPRDRYYTPAWPVRLLVEVLEDTHGYTDEQAPWIFGEPCSGRGDIMQAIRDAGHDGRHADIDPPPLEECTTHQRPLEEDLMRGDGYERWKYCTWLATNPPYTNAAEYVRRLLDIVDIPDVHLGVATLHPLPWLEACDDRADLVSREDLSVIVLPRIDFEGPHVDADASGYPSAFCWCVWSAQPFGVEVMTKRDRARAKGQIELFEGATDANR